MQKKDQRKLAKKKERKKKVKDKLRLRRAQKRAVERENRKLKKEERDVSLKPEPIKKQSIQKSKELRELESKLEHNMEIFKALEEEYDKEHPRLIT